MILVCSKCGSPMVRVVQSASQTVIVCKVCGAVTDISDGGGALTI
jgi:ribosomal protein S27E